MLTILKISFGPPKIYSYLFDPRTKAKIKTGDILKKFAGCSYRGPYFSELKILDIAQVETLPPQVTAVIHIKDPVSMECTVSYLSAETKMKLMTPRVKPPIPKNPEEKQDIVIKEFEKILGFKIQKLTL